MKRFESSSACLMGCCLLVYHAEVTRGLVAALAAFAHQ
jgi:hypothetical protein